MAVVLRPINDDDRTVLNRLWQLYRHDLSDFRDIHLDRDGLFHTGRMPSYFDYPDRRGYLINTDTRLAGFVLVSGVIKAPRRMDEFFIVRSVRRRGVGYAAVREAMRLHPGPWEIAFQEANHHAARFWRALAAKVDSDGHWEERRPVPGKPHLPPDIWISLSTP